MLETRDYQERIHKKALEYIRQHTYRKNNGQIRIDVPATILIVSPTGSGKSCMGLKLAQELQYNTIWMAHRKELLKQINNTNKDMFHMDINILSMFDKNINRCNSKTTLVIDECVPYDCKVQVLVNNIPQIVNIGSVVDNNIGTHILSYNGKHQEYKKILNRNMMGKKQLYKITYENKNGKFYLFITENGKIFTNKGYKTPLELTKDNIICCQTYDKECVTTYANKTSNNLQKYPEQKTQICPTVQMRMWQESKMESRKIQQVCIQPSSETNETCNPNQNTETNCTWDCFGRRIDTIYSKSQRWKYWCREIAHSSLNKTSILCRLALQQTQKYMLDIAKNFKKLRIWKKSSYICNLFNKGTVRNRGKIIQSNQKDNSKIFESINATRNIGLVDGRWFNSQFSNTLFFKTRESNYFKLACKYLWYKWNFGFRQKSKEIFHKISSTKYLQNVKIGIPSCTTTIQLQVPKILSTVANGKILKIEKTNNICNTYDIGVEGNHNFFADGILIHNCQHAPSDSALNVVNSLKPDIIIGLTATPYRLDTAKLCFEKVITDAGIHQLIREGWLSPFNQYLIENEWTPQNVVKIFMQSPEKWGKSISFWRNTAEAIEANNLLKNNGIKTEVVTGSSPRDDIIEDFIAGKLQHLTNCEILTEGFDVPDLVTSFIRPASKGPTIQMAGRALRKHHSKTIANIVQSQHTKYPFSNHAAPKEQLLENNNMWKSLDPKNLDEIVNKMIIRKIKAIG